jgi:hypothetical protein
VANKVTKAERQALYNKAMKIVKRLIEAGKEGKLLQIEAAARLWRQTEVSKDRARHAVAKCVAQLNKSM